MKLIKQSSKWEELTGAGRNRLLLWVWIVRGQLKVEMGKRECIGGCHEVTA